MTTRFGILGFGNHAIKRLVPAFSGASEAVLHGLYRRDLVKAQANANQFAIPHVFATAEELCASPEIDAIFIVSPDALHLEHVRIAARAGKPILCEKPLGMNVGEVEQMLAATNEANVFLGVAQNMRYNQSIATVRAWVQEGRIGKPRLAHAEFCYNTANSPRTWITDPALACGGPIGDVGIHCIDALSFVLGDKVTAVSTIAQQDEASGAVESQAVVSLDYQAGTLGLVTVSARAAYRTLLEVVGEDGVITCELAMTVDQPVTVIHRKNGSVVTEEKLSNADAFSRMLDSFAAAIKGQGSYLAPGLEGLTNQRVLDAAYTSWRTGKRVELPA